VRPVVDTLPDGVVAAVRMPVADSDHPDRLVYQLVVNETVNRTDPVELDTIVHQAFQSQLAALGDFLDRARQGAFAAAGGQPAPSDQAGNDDIPPGFLATPVAVDDPAAVAVREAFDALRSGRLRPPSLLHNVSGTPEHGEFHFTDGLTTPVSLVVVPAAIGVGVQVYPPSSGTAPVRIFLGASARIGSGQLRAIADQVHDWLAPSAAKAPTVAPRPGDPPGEPVWLPKDPKRLPFGIPIEPTTVEPERDPLGDPPGPPPWAPIDPERPPFGDPVEEPDAEEPPDAERPGRPGEKPSPDKRPGQQPDPKGPGRSDDDEEGGEDEHEEATYRPGQGLTIDPPEGTYLDPPQGLTVEPLPRGVEINPGLPDGVSEYEPPAGLTIDPPQRLTATSPIRKPEIEWIDPPGLGLWPDPDSLLPPSVRRPGKPTIRIPRTVGGRGSTGDDSESREPAVVSGGDPSGGGAGGFGGGSSSTPPLVFTERHDDVRSGVDGFLQYLPDGFALDEVEWSEDGTIALIKGRHHGVDIEVTLTLGGDTLTVYAPGVPELRDDGTVRQTFAIDLPTQLPTTVQGRDIVDWVSTVFRSSLDAWFGRGGAESKRLIKASQQLAEATKQYQQALERFQEAEREPSVLGRVRAENALSRARRAVQELVEAIQELHQWQRVLGSETAGVTQAGEVASRLMAEIDRLHADLDGGWSRVKDGEAMAGAGSETFAEMSSELSGLLHETTQALSAIWQQRQAERGALLASKVDPDGTGVLAAIGDADDRISYWYLVDVAIAGAVSFPSSAGRTDTRTEAEREEQRQARWSKNIRAAIDDYVGERLPDGAEVVSTEDGDPVHWAEDGTSGVVHVRYRNGYTATFAIELDPAQDAVFEVTYQGLPTITEAGGVTQGFRMVLPAHPVGRVSDHDLQQWVRDVLRHVTHTIFERVREPGVQQRLGHVSTGLAELTALHEEAKAAVEAAGTERTVQAYFAAQETVADLHVKAAAMQQRLAELAWYASTLPAQPITALVQAINDAGRAVGQAAAGARGLADALGQDDSLDQTIDVSIEEQQTEDGPQSVATVSFRADVALAQLTRAFEEMSSGFLADLADARQAVANGWLIHLGVQRFSARPPESVSSHEQGLAEARTQLEQYAQQLAPFQEEHAEIYQLLARGLVSDIVPRLVDLSGRLRDEARLAADRDSLTAAADAVDQAVQLVLVAPSAPPGPDPGQPGAPDETSDSGEVPATAAGETGTGPVPVLAWAAQALATAQAHLIAHQAN
jgi:hypothetical protein